MSYPVWMPRPLARYVLDLLEEFLKLQRPLNLGTWRPNPRIYSQAYDSLDDPNVRLHSWNRYSVPLLDASSLGIRKTRIDVPANLVFNYLNEYELPRQTPVIRFGPPTRAHYALGAKATYSVRRPSQRREANRRRKDQKIPSGLRRIYAASNRLFNRPSEYLDFITAFTQNQGNPYGILTALAFNEIIDHTYGARARFLKDKIYRQAWYKLPVGFDTLARFFR